MRVLVVEDDEGISQGLKLALRQEGWAVDVVATIQGATAALLAEPFEIVVLDLGLADGDGAQVLRGIRDAKPGGLPDPGTPVLIMTARDQVAFRIAGLDMGADDYVTKPFEPSELAARMRALCRRASGRAQSLLRWRDLEIDPALRTVKRAGNVVSLSSREFALLLLLVQASPRVLSRAQIETSLYDWAEALGSNAVEVHVHHLRKKLGEEVIRTMRGVGYFTPADAGT